MKKKEPYHIEDCKCNYPFSKSSKHPGDRIRNVFGRFDKIFNKTNAIRNQMIVEALESNFEKSSQIDQTLKKSDKLLSKQKKQNAQKILRQN